jgi:hypothetical protein
LDGLFGYAFPRDWLAAVTSPFTTELEIRPVQGAHEPANTWIYLLKVE